MQSIHSNFKFNERRMQCKSIRSDAFSFILGSTGLVGEHARWMVAARCIGQRFHAASQVLVDARELAKAKRFNYGKS
jgi:nitric oxide synthase oxygenase domain/subunit